MFEINYESGSMSLMSLKNDANPVSMNRAIDSDEFVELMNDPRLESHLGWTVGINTFGNVESATLRNHIINILEAINKQKK